jgi:hypothetical protein
MVAQPALMHLATTNVLLLTSIGPVRQLVVKPLPPLTSPLLFRRFIGGLLLLGEIRVAKFLFRYIDVHRELRGVFVVMFLQVVGHYLVEALTKFPEKERATVYFLTRKAQVYARRTHVEAAMVAAGIAQTLVQELVESELGSRKRQHN